MSQLLFSCPDCSFSKRLLQSKIPATAKQCRCPSCRKVFNLSDVVTPVDGRDGTSQAAASCQAGVNETSTGSQQDSTGDGEKPMDKSDELLEAALAYLQENNDIGALCLLEEAEKLNSTPKVRSHLAYCSARVRSDFSAAVQTCTQALKEEPRNAEHYLNLARIYLLADKRGPAFQTLRKGLKLGPSPQLMQELRTFERRKPPVFSSLPRDHGLNRNLGKLLSRLRLR